MKSSKDGVDLLKILALSVRPEKDFRLLINVTSQVGTLLNNASCTEINSVLTGGQSPPIIVPNAIQLELGEALNKIAHADPREDKSSFAADRLRHEVVLTGEKSGCPWIAVIDIPAMCNAIKALPDKDIVPSVE
ncbi:hypothetical protein [Synechococcus sp. BA-132 BA5]|uniref:hypothetical protein n=1 Tax=Synechococcus sp. BA-132 BA5 TaxID=3110252 RepID=UPI002B1F67F5|nr:hypothetical protein [Synechococcus sp. BA-132 BA5]MEA5414143.1 hypothetical protein [Synechococcus sp. BA-132 BA5]